MKTPGRFGVDHHGIIDKRGRGGTRVIHNAKGVGAIVSPFTEFAGGNPVELVVEAQPGNRIEVATRAREDLGRPYDVLGSNCEHLAFRASTGLEKSPQLRETVGGVAMAGGVGLFISGVAAKKDGGGRVLAGAALFALGLMMQ